jgi:hypothetical protein
MGFDACGFYVSFQNGWWILREFHCILEAFGFWMINGCYPNSLGNIPG